MKFTFKKYIQDLILCNLIFNFLLILVLILLVRNIIGIVFLIFMFLNINIDFIRDICKIKRFVKSQSEQKIIVLEKNMSHSKLVYDEWYLTDEYMLSLKKLKKISYQDIIVIEEGFTLMSGYKGNTIGYKQNLYLKNGEVYKLKSMLTSSNSDLFKEFILERNPYVYFGIIEDYSKFVENKEKDNIEK